MRIDRSASRAHNSGMQTLAGFLAMGIVAFVIWRVLSRQESSDPGFERRLKADERRARANREAAARDSHGGSPPAPPAA